MEFKIRLGTPFLTSYKIIKSIPKTEAYGQEPCVNRGMKHLNHNGTFGIACSTISLLADILDL